MSLIDDDALLAEVVKLLKRHRNRLQKDIRARQWTAEEIRPRADLLNSTHRLITLLDCVHCMVEEFDKPSIGEYFKDT